MEKVKSPRQQYSEELKLTVLKDMYENNVSHLSVARKYGVSEACTYLWEKKYPVDSKLLSLSDQVITRVKAMQKDHKPTKKREAPLTREEQLVKEIENLRKALAYSELRNEALHEVLKIGKEQYGLDLLKKAGAKQ